MAGKPGPSTGLEKAQARLVSLVDTVAPAILKSDGTPAPDFPKFDDLPRVRGQPQGCLWGHFDKDGVRDELGTLNLLTPALIRAAAGEIQTGERIQLDRVLEGGQGAAFGRKPFEQRLLDHHDRGPSFGFDDEVALNTQSSSQWDGLKHFAHQATRTYYNGLTHEEAKTTTTNGIHTWSDAGGIVGRGVLVDWLRWYERERGSAGPPPATRHEITTAELEEALRWQGTTTRPGDILLVRSGYGKWFTSASAQEKGGSTTAIGVQGSEASVRWLYGRHFAAVAGDTIAFEAWPPQRGAPCLHEWLLAQWGTPIGELWDLEALGAMCERQGRWSFFLTSAPLRVKGGVGSPPGVIAIF